MSPSAREPKYADGRSPIAMPSGRNPVGRANSVGNRSVCRLVAVAVARRRCGEDRGGGRPEGDDREPAGMSLNHAKCTPSMTQWSDIDDCLSQSAGGYTRPRKLTGSLHLLIG
jgi:hypothetical protein